MVKQVTREYETKDPQIIRYLEKAKCLINKLQKFTLLRIPNEENSKADTLSRLASSDLSKHIRVVYVKILKVLNIDKEEVM